MWIVEKAMYRRMHNPDLEDFDYPYDLGWWSNIKQVFINDNVVKGNGVEWPIKEGCHQYTLTVSFINLLNEIRNYEFNVFFYNIVRTNCPKM